MRMELIQQIENKEKELNHLKEEHNQNIENEKRKV